MMIFNRDKPPKRGIKSGTPDFRNDMESFITKTASEQHIADYYAERAQEALNIYKTVSALVSEAASGTEDVDEFMNGLISTDRILIEGAAIRVSDLLTQVRTLADQETEAAEEALDSIATSIAGCIEMAAGEFAYYRTVLTEAADRASQFETALKSSLGDWTNQVTDFISNLRAEIIAGATLADHLEGLSKEFNMDMSAMDGLVSDYGGYKGVSPAAIYSVKPLIERAFTVVKSVVKKVAGFFCGMLLKAKKAVQKVVKSYEKVATPFDVVAEGKGGDLCFNQFASLGLCENKGSPITETMRYDYDAGTVIIQPLMKYASNESPIPVSIMKEGTNEFLRVGPYNFGGLVRYVASGDEAMMYSTDWIGEVISLYDPMMRMVDWDRDSWIDIPFQRDSVDHAQIYCHLEFGASPSLTLTPLHAETYLNHSGYVTGHDKMDGLSCAMGQLTNIPYPLYHKSMEAWDAMIMKRYFSLLSTDLFGELIALPDYNPATWLSNVDKKLVFYHMDVTVEVVGENVNVEWSCHAPSGSNQVVIFRHYIKPISGFNFDFPDKRLPTKQAINILGGDYDAIEEARAIIEKGDPKDEAKLFNMYYEGVMYSELYWLTMQALLKGWEETGEIRNVQDWYPSSEGYYAPAKKASGSEIENTHWMAVASGNAFKKTSGPNPELVLKYSWCYIASRLASILSVTNEMFVPLRRPFKPVLRIKTDDENIKNYETWMDRAITVTFVAAAVITTAVVLRKVAIRNSLRRNGVQRGLEEKLASGTATPADFKLWRKARRADRLTKIMSKGAVSSSSSVLGYQKFPELNFDELTGGTAEIMSIVEALQTRIG